MKLEYQEEKTKGKSSGKILAVLYAFKICSGWQIINDIITPDDK